MSKRYIVQRQYGEWCIVDAHAHINVTIAVGCPIGQSGTEAGREYAEQIAHGLNSIERITAENAALRELCKDAEDALSWPQSFYNDVTNTAPEYIERCGDWDAVQYMLQDCDNVRQRLRAALAAQEAV